MQASCELGLRAVRGAGTYCHSHPGWPTGDKVSAHVTFLEGSSRRLR